MKHSEFLKGLLRSIWALLSKRPISITGLKNGITDIYYYCLSWSALVSRQMGVRTIVIIGFLSTIYSIFLFISHSISPDAPSAAHDIILKTRWSSPKASEKIIIVDIDEHSLAALAPQYGRWPWPRSVLAEGVEKLSNAGAKGLVFNVMLSDPDKSNPDSDGVMEFVSATIPNVAYPIIRLNKDNDGISKLKTSELFAYTGDKNQGADKNIAVILPTFESMINKVGIANQMPDEDGIIRRYPVIWTDENLQMPSIVARGLQVSGYKIDTLSGSINLNWRNKSEPYKRVSFSDLLLANDGDQKLAQFKDAMVVIGVSAPGIGMTQATSVKPIEDSNEILATALDDIINDTHLRVMPAWLILIIEIGTIWGLVWVGTGRRLALALDRAIFLVQSGAASITLFSASYTKYLIDLSSCMAFGAGIYAIIRIVQSLDAGWSRAKPGYRKAINSSENGTVLLIGYNDAEVSQDNAAQLQNLLESSLGHDRVIRVDDLFGGENFVRSTCEDYSCQFCMVADDALSDLMIRIQKLKINIDIRDVQLSVPWDPESEQFKLAVAPTLLRQCADIIEKSQS